MNGGWHQPPAKESRTEVDIFRHQTQHLEASDYLLPLGGGGGWGGGGRGGFHVKW